eukprot:3749976-Prymnesium_polylepis.2
MVPCMRPCAGAARPSERADAQDAKAIAPRRCCRARRGGGRWRTCPRLWRCPPQAGTLTCLLGWRTATAR